MSKRKKSKLRSIKRIHKNRYAEHSQAEERKEELDRKHEGEYEPPKSPKILETRPYQVNHQKLIPIQERAPRAFF
jgi:hypothetical protein